MTPLPFGDLLERLDKIAPVLLKKNHIDGAGFKLCLKMRVVDMAYDLLMQELGKEERLFLAKETTDIPETTVVKLVYLYESLLLQMRMEMDLWAKFVHRVKGLTNLGHSFNAHKKNISRAADTIYADFVRDMEWFNKMKDARDTLKTGDITRVFNFDKGQKGFVIYAIGYPPKGDKPPSPKLLSDVCDG
ncbi:hypothetical protein CL635_01415, partial [bacterium]|nr:hypothetical protein [bacterium]